MIDPNGYILVRIRNRMTTEEAENLDMPEVHPVMMVVRPANMFNDIVDALIAKGEQEFPDDFIVLPYW